MHPDHIRSTPKFCEGTMRDTEQEHMRATGRRDVAIS